MRTSSCGIACRWGSVAPEVGRRVAPSRLRRSWRSIGGSGLGEDLTRRLDIGCECAALRLLLIELGWECGQGLVDFGCCWCGGFLGFFSTTRHQGLVAGHAKDALRRACIAQVLNLSLAVPASETVCTEGLISSEDSKILDLVSAVVAAIRAVVADERSVSEQQQVGVRVQQGAAGVAAEAVDVPSVARCALSVYKAECSGAAEGKARGPVGGGAGVPSSKAFPSSRIWGCC